jgi:hypothetical protein
MRYGAFGAFLVSIVVLGGAGTADGFVRFDFEQRYLVLPGRYMKDRCFIKRKTEWHCFMIVGSDSAIGWSVPGNEVAFAHATTRDFRRWEMHPDILSSGTGSWDERNIWAPGVMRWGPGYRMYYTGVDSSVCQSMGLAESSDLFEWRSNPRNPLYHPDTSWAAWRRGRWSNCRDPDVFRIGDTLYALNTCTMKDGRGAVDLAVSADGLQWLDRGPLLVNDADSVLESARLVEREGIWYLFFSEQDVLGVSVLRAPSMRGPWIMGERRLMAPGQAAEILGDEPATLISRHASYRGAGGAVRHVVTVDSLLWDASGNPYIGEDGAFWDDWSCVRLGDPDPCFGEAGPEVLEVDSAFAYQPTFGENPSFRGEDVSIGAGGNSWLGSRERYRGPLSDTAEGGLVGDVAVGGIRSRDFRVTGSRISFLIGGSDDPELFIALRDSESHRFIHSESPDGGETLEPRVWGTDSLYGRLVYVEIVDGSASGHISIDEIVESEGPAPPPDAPFPGRLFDPYPNPFSAGVVFPVRMDRDASVAVDVYDASGRHVKRIFSGNARIGFLEFGWGGVNERGDAAAAGVYFLRVEAEGVVRALKIVKVD